MNQSLCANNKLSHGAIAGLLSLVFALFITLSPVPGKAEQAEPPPPVTQVNINTADANTLAQQLQGVGVARAQEIIRYREQYGPFASIEELSEVKGIGPATLERNRALITLE
ncbi:ComEA family DNA-binding protein [Haliea atlantica]|nr:competence protein ComEA [Haliea sp.]|tara:strand:+ start:50058 stop:50393 length:336 start_codon:yes stop_codon:yes gene_type:complete